MQGLGYVFSASLPPYLAVAGIHVLEHLRQQGRELLPLLRSRAHALRRDLSKVAGEAQERGGDPAIGIAVVA